MTKDEFINGYCERSRITREQFFENGDAVLCDCGEGTCAGWKYQTQPDPGDDCGRPLACAEPHCEALHPNACSADLSAAGWCCPRHEPVDPNERLGGTVMFAPGAESSPVDLIISAWGPREVVRFKPDGTIELADGYVIETLRRESTKGGKP